MNTSTVPGATPPPVASAAVQPAANQSLIDLFTGIGVGGQGLAQILAGVTAQRQEDANAELLKQLGLLSAEEERRFTRSVIQSQIANTDSPGGSSLDIQLETAVEGEFEALNRKFGFDAQASAAKARGRAALTTGIFQAGGTILGGFQRALGQNPRTREPGSTGRLPAGTTATQFERGLARNRVA